MGSEIEIQAWKQARLSKLTASKFYTCMGERGIGEGGTSYIDTKVGEELTGKSGEPEIDTDATRWGKLYEPVAVNEFGKAKGLHFLVVQKLIHDVETRFSCTPDALWVKSESTCETMYDVSCAEIKCYPTFANHVACAKCSTPAEIKKQDKEAYWQLIFQMDLCDALYGYLVYFHPDFKAGKLRIIEFRKKELITDFRLLKERKLQAIEIFNADRELLINIKN